MTTKLRNPDSTNGPLNEIYRSKILNLLGKAAAIISFVDSIVSIVNDPSLTGPKKVAQIIFTLAFSVAAMQGAATIGLFFVNPVTGAILALLLAVGRPRRTRNPRILEVHQPLFEEFRRRRSCESDFALQAETDRLDEQLVSSLRETHVVVPPHIAELVEQIFDHLHWLLVERFDSYVDFERDVTIASIWLGSGFNEYLHTGRPHGLRKP